MFGELMDGARNYQISLNKYDRLIENAEDLLIMKRMLKVKTIRREDILMVFGEDVVIEEETEADNPDYRG